GARGAAGRARGARPGRHRQPAGDPGVLGHRGALMANIGTAYVEVKPDTKGFGDEVDRGVTGALGGIGATLAKAGLVAGTALATGVTAAGGWGLKLAAEGETAAIGFETMLGSAQAAGSFMKDLQAFAAKTPFEFPELRDAASRLVAVGVNTADV